MVSITGITYSHDFGDDPPGNPDVDELQNSFDIVKNELDKLIVALNKFSALDDQLSREGTRLHHLHPEVVAFLRPYAEQIDNPFPWQVQVDDAEVTTPPASPSDGDRYLIAAAGATDAWLGQENKIAEWFDDSSTWVFTDPDDGYATWDKDSNLAYFFTGAAWQKIDLVGASITVSQINSESATDGQPIVADGAGGSRWGGAVKTEALTVDWQYLTQNYPGPATLAHAFQNGGVNKALFGYNAGLDAFEFWRTNLSESIMRLYLASGELRLSGNLNMDSKNILAVNSMLVSTTPSSPKTGEGSIAWDPDDHTLLVGTDIAGVSVNVGQESQIRAWNGTGATIPNGSALYRIGVDPTTKRYNVGLALASATGADVNKRDFFAISTHDIPTGTEGIAVDKGKLRDWSNSFTEGAELWLSPTVAGTFTETKPLLPDSQIRAGRVLETGAAGAMRVDIQDLSLSGVGIAQNQARERTGFIHDDDGKPIDSAGNELLVSSDNASLTLTITPTSGVFYFFSLNNLFAKVGPQTVQWTDVEGDHYFYYDANGDIQHSTTIDNTYILGPKAFIAYLYWDATNSRVLLDAPVVEMHGIQMDGATHLAIHQDRGARHVSGLTLGDFQVDENGSSDAHAQFSVATGEIADEDLHHFTSDISSITGLPIVAIEGAGLAREYSKAGFSVLQDTDIGVGGTGRLVRNYNNAGTWTYETVPVNDYVLCHVLAIGTGHGGKKVYAVPGQASYANVIAARDGVETELASISSVLPFAEVRPLGSVIFQTGSYANAVNARVTSTADGDDYTDKRKDVFTGGGGFTSSNHNDFAGRSELGAHPSSALTVDTTNFNNNLSAADDTPQKALETLDGLITGSASNQVNVTQSGHGFAVGDAIKRGTGAYTKAQADSAVNVSGFVGIVSQVTDANNFRFNTPGPISGLSGLTDGEEYFISAATAGLLTTTAPAIKHKVLVATSASGGYVQNDAAWEGGYSQANSVDSYGAVGDGTTDDRTAIIAAIAANDEIQFTTGKTYYISDKVVVDKSLTILGNGASIKVPETGTVKAAFQFYNSDTDLTLIAGIRDLTFLSPYFPATPSPSNEGYAIVLGPVTGDSGLLSNTAMVTANVERCRFYGGAGAIGGNLYNTHANIDSAGDRIELTDCLFDQQSRSAVLFYFILDTTIARCQFNNMLAYSVTGGTWDDLKIGDEGVGGTSGNRFIVTRKETYNYGAPVNIVYGYNKTAGSSLTSGETVTFTGANAFVATYKSSAPQSIYTNSVTVNIADNIMNGGSIYAYGDGVGSDPRQDGSVIQGNDITYTRADGVFMDLGGGALIANNKIKECAGYGIQKWICAKTAIIGNTITKTSSYGMSVSTEGVSGQQALNISDNNISEIGGSIGIELTGGQPLGYFTVSGNVMKLSAGATGVSLNALAHDNYSIVNNTAAGATTAVSDGGTGTNKTVSANY